ncbi:MAG: bifunctional riboflavin kinase/FAD synthetase [Steroidobacteraceae bacterium]
MQLIRDPSPRYFPAAGSAVTIGGFDGLHLGHQALIARTVDLARDSGLAAVLISFEPLPREYLRRLAPPARLTTLRERMHILGNTGIDCFCALRFTENLRAISAEQFAALLREKFAVRHVVVGHDFRFGRDGAASAQSLRSDGARHGFSVDVLAPITQDGVRISSTAVRAALAGGDLAAARNLLGRAYTMCGRVIRGEQLGRTLGFPTANMRLGRRASPLDGIFAVRAHGATVGVRDGVASLGTRPTVGGTVPLLEVHLFDFAGDIYGDELCVEFIARLRSEQHFPSLETMQAQMHVDAAEARARLSAYD